MLHHYYITYENENKKNDKINDLKWEINSASLVNIMSFCYLFIITVLFLLYNKDAYVCRV